MDSTTHPMLRHFEHIQDPRRSSSVKHALNDIFLVALSAAISGIESFHGMEDFAEIKIEWLRSTLGFKGEIPSHDTLRRVFSLIDPTEFEDAFIAWMADVEVLSDGSVVAIDGKTLRGSGDKRKEVSPIHLVSAWAVENGVSLGHVKVSDKSNEITAIPDLLDLLTVKGCIVSIDAIGCQKEITEKITSKRGGFAIAVKANQKKLLEALEVQFASDRDPAIKSFETKEKSRGREEVRRFFFAKASKIIKELGWVGVENVGHIRSTRIVNGKASYEDRFYILRKVDCVEKFASVARSHWAVENSYHWVLDVTMSEDQCQVFDRIASRNLATLRRVVLNKLKKQNDKRSLKGRMRACALNDGYRTKSLELAT